MEGYLRRIRYDEGRHADRLVLPGYGVAEITAEPTVNFGRPYFTATGTPPYVVSGCLDAGENVAEIADDFGIPGDHVAEVADRHARGAA